MDADRDASGATTVGDASRRDSVLESALATFARFGYRKTSMDEVAGAARISRPGLYFLFASKEALFRAAVTRALEADLAAVRGVLGDSSRRLDDRLLDSFDHWAGRYIGPMARDTPALIDDNPGLLGDIVDEAPRLFAALVTNAIAAENPDGEARQTGDGQTGAGQTGAGQTGQASADHRAQTLISVSIGLKHQVETREEYRARLRVAIALLLR